jgi:hypothetical protein
MQHSFWAISFETQLRKFCNPMFIQDKMLREEAVKCVAKCILYNKEGKGHKWWDEKEGREERAEGGFLA